MAFQKSLSTATKRINKIMILVGMSLICGCIIGGGAWFIYQTKPASLYSPISSPENKFQNPEQESAFAGSQFDNPPVFRNILPVTTPMTATPYPTYTYTPSPIPQTGLVPSSTPIPSSTSPPTPTPMLVFGNPAIIGYSVLGRPLEVYTFGSGSNERMIIAGIHGGNEYNTILLANKLIRHLAAHPEIIPPEVKLFILPSLNPDGEARSHDMYGRANQNGVDLNHNWPAFWKANWSRAGCWHYLTLSGGSAPASEPETQALMSFLISHHVQALISYHSAAMGIFPGGIPPDANSLKLAAAVAEVSDYPYPPIDTGCDMSGALVDWASVQGIAALDVELTDHEHTDFQQNLKILEVLLKWKP